MLTGAREPLQDRSWGWWVAQGTELAARALTRDVRAQDTSPKGHTIIEPVWRVGVGVTGPPKRQHLALDSGATHSEPADILEGVSAAGVTTGQVR